ncbi:GtrA family protein [Acinetobacter sp. SWBY1]|uniref:GtrA family protein n=1 Tax=Acinetobacter sp. SWBY1 TaxID=2079596 RepID=UPI000CF2C962|nr:GtrA family protein [Acinetobacter sp. SWBY1]AVH49921.1 translocase [Acinetobacter sp. SWBY1]
MFKLFSRYFSIGILNTSLHWIVFLLLVVSLDISQMIANLLAFSVAATFSFFANSKWTFKSDVTLFRYFSFVIFMGTMAVTLGYIADKLNLPALVTLMTFSMISLFLGFIYSNFFVFRDKK